MRRDDKRTPGKTYEYLDESDDDDGCFCGYLALVSKWLDGSSRRGVVGELRNQALVTQVPKNTRRAHTSRFIIETIVGVPDLVAIDLGIENTTRSSGSSTRPSWYRPNTTEAPQLRPLSSPEQRRAPHADSFPIAVAASKRADTVTRYRLERSGAGAAHLPPPPPRTARTANWAVERLRDEGQTLTLRQALNDLRLYIHI